MSSSVSYQGALVLNQLAIDTIQHGSYEHGLATLKDAIGLIKASFVSQSNASPLCWDVDAKIQLARERLAQATEHDTLSSTPIRVVDDYLTIETMEASMYEKEDATLSPIVLVRLDASAPNDKRTPTALDFESAVILQNMGAVYYSLSQQRSVESIKYLAAAIRLWQLSHGILMKLLQGRPEHFVVLPEILHVAIVTMQNQIKALCEDENEQSETIATVRATLDKLRSSLRHMLHKLEELWVSSLHLAPAA